MNKIVLLGAGNLATNLGQAILKSTNYEIMQVYSRTMDSANILANVLGAEPVTDIEHLVTDADIYIFALKDDVLESVANKIPPNGGLWLHTAGSLPLSLLTNIHTRSGVIYPLQTFSKNKLIDFKTIPLFLEAENEDDVILLKSFCTQLSESVYELDSVKRQYLHLAGVFVNNFVNHLYQVADSLLDDHKIPFQVMLPLINETAQKVSILSPADAQTGPAIRCDKKVMDYHHSLIKDEKVRNLYRLMSENISLWATKNRTKK